MIQALKLNVILFFQKIINTVKLKYLLFHIEKTKYLVYKNFTLANSCNLNNIQNHVEKLNNYLHEFGYFEYHIYYEVTVDKLRSLLSDLITMQRELTKLNR